MSNPKIRMARNDSGEFYATGIELEGSIVGDGPTLGDLAGWPAPPCTLNFTLTDARPASHRASHVEIKPDGSIVLTGVERGAPEHNGWAWIDEDGERRTGKLRDG